MNIARSRPSDAPDSAPSSGSKSGRGRDESCPRTRSLRRRSCEPRAAQVPAMVALAAPESAGSMAASSSAQGRGSAGSGTRLNHCEVVRRLVCS